MAVKFIASPHDWLFIFTHIYLIYATFSDVWDLERFYMDKVTF